MNELIDLEADFDYPSRLLIWAYYGSIYGKSWGSSESHISMNMSSRALIYLLTLVSLCGCSMGQQAGFVPLDASKYPTEESLQASLRKAQSECTSLKSKKAEDNAVAAQKAIFEQNVNNSRDTFLACMNARGFVEQSKPSAQ